MQHLGRLAVMGLLSIWLVVANLPVSATTTRASSLTPSLFSPSKGGTGTGSGSAIAYLRVGANVTKPADVAATTSHAVMRSSSALWDLQRDFRTWPQQANPQYVQYWDTFPIWTFSWTVNKYLLPQFITNAFSVNGLQQWQEPSGSNPLDGLPALGINATGSTQHVYGMVWPPNVIRAHPSALSPVNITWTSPVTFTHALAVSEQLSDLDPTCGTGISWLLFQQSGQHDTTLARGTLRNGYTGQTGVVNNVSILMRDQITLQISALNGDPGCDSTGVDLSIG